MARALVFVAAASLFAGCGGWIDGKKKQQEVIELSDDRFNCLNALPTTIKSLAAGEVAETALRESFSCVRDALAYFQQRARGSVADGYTTQDLRHFFGKYFLKDDNISPELANGLMRLKRGLFGGSDSTLTKAEIDRLIEALKVVEDQSVKLTPHIKILFPQGHVMVDETTLIKATSQARASLQAILKAIDLSHNDYSFEEAKDLLGSLAQFAGGASGVPLFRSVSDWLPIISAVKVVFFGEHAALNTPYEWTSAIATLVDLYEILLRYNYFLKDNDFASSRQLGSALKFADKLLVLLETSNQVRNAGRIPFRAIDDLIDRVVEKKLIQLPVSADAIKDLYQKIVVGILDPLRKGDSRGADALERVHLLSLRRELAVFRLNQTFIDLSVDDKGPVGREFIKTKAQLFAAVELIAKLSPDPLEREALLGAWTKFRQLLLKERPVTFTSKGRLWIAADPNRVEFNWKGMTRFNIMHLLTRGFMMGYGDDRDPAKANVDERGLQRWYSDFNRFGIEFKAFDPRSGNAGSRSHKEANYFTFSGNGDARVDMDEMFEYVSFLFSAGVANVDAVTKSAQDAGCARADRDVFDLPWLDEECFKKSLRQSFSQNFDNLPGLARWVDRMSDAEFEEFYVDWMAASRTSDPRGRSIESADIRTGVMILHYAESMFILNDRNRDDVLEVTEIEAAAPRFFNILRPMSPVKAESFLTEAFVVLVCDGKKPGATNLIGFQGRRFGNWLGLTRDVRVGRGNIFKVFSNLKSEITGVKKQ